jgi:hypothetical protein
MVVALVGVLLSLDPTACGKLNRKRNGASGQNVRPSTRQDRLDVGGAGVELGPGFLASLRQQGLALSLRFHSLIPFTGTIVAQFALRVGEPGLRSSLSLAKACPEGTFKSKQNS